MNSVVKTGRVEYIPIVYQVFYFVVSFTGFADSVVYVGRYPSVNFLNFTAARKFSKT